MMFPPLREQMTLTARGEKSSASSSSEVYLEGYTIDGATFLCGKDLIVKDGHWFWSGETYAWRPETDLRQPEGMTRSVLIEIPVGWSRTLNFNGNPWRGIVEVNNGAESWIIDTYSEDSSTISLEIGRSKTSNLLYNQIIKLLIYLLSLSVETAIMVLLLFERERIFQWRKQHPGIILMAFIALLQLFVAWHYAGIDCFWLDELYEVAWAENANNLWDHCFNSGAAAPLPIWMAIFHLWYQMAPYGEKWILVLPEVATSVGIFLVGMCGREYSGPRAGVCAVLLGLISKHILGQCSYEIRSYGLYFASAALLLYLYLRSWRSEGHKINLPLMCIVMTFFAGMHYYAVIYCVALFLIDVYAYFVFKIKTRSIIPYVVAAISYIPNLICQKMIGVNSSWQATPDLSAIKNLILYLNNDSILITLFFLFGSSLLICNWLAMIKMHRKVDESLFLKSTTPLFLIIFKISIFFIYGRFINPSVSLWSNRYFCALFPCTFVIAASAFNMLCKWADQFSSKKILGRHVASVFLAILLVPSSLIVVIETGKQVREPWRQAADWIYAQSNYIFSSNTIILTTADQQVNSGWEKYYIERQGRRDALPVVTIWEISGQQLKKYDRIYLLELHGAFPKSRLESLQDYGIIEKPGYGITVYSRKE